MKTKALLAAAFIAATSFSVNALADTSSVKFNKLANTADDPETFYCHLFVADAATTKVTLKNNAEKVSGFKSDGTLVLPIDNHYHINNVYFKAFHDPDERFKGQNGSVTVTSDSGTIVCKHGEGIGRTLMPGNYN